MARKNTVLTVPAKAIVKNLNRNCRYEVSGTYDEILDVLNEIDQLSKKFNALLEEKKAEKIELLKQQLAALEA